MQPLQFLVPLDALEAVEPILKYVILGLVLLYMGTLFVSHRKHVKQAEDGDDDEEISRFLPHTVTTVLLILASFALLVLEPHAGMVMSVLVLGVFIADFFEHEARRVEARTNKELERPKAALGASVVALLYAVYQSLFFVIAPVWNSII
jgi:hypothetical protein